MRLPSVLLMVLTTLLLTACTGASADRPPDIAYGQQECDECRMLIDDARFASAYVTTGGEARRFDDVGDMLIHHRRQAEEVASFWVHDYETGEWLRAETAFYVMAEGIHTPMGHGIVALADRDRAERLAREHGGMVMTWQEALERGPSGAGMDHGGMKGMR